MLRYIHVFWEHKIFYACTGKLYFFCLQMLNQSAIDGNEHVEYKILLPS